MREAEEILRQRQTALSPSNPKAPSLWQQIRGLTKETELAPRLSTVGRISLAAGVFEAGWLIGSGANAKWLRIGLPPKTDGPQYYQWDSIVFREARSRSYYGAYYPTRDGWVPVLRQTCCSYNEVELWDSPPCPFSGIVPPAPFVVEGPAPTTATCWTEDGSKAVDVNWGWAPENGLGAPGPIEPYNGQPYSLWSPDPWPPPQGTVEQSIENELEKPENNLLRQWLNYQLGSPNETDALGIGPPNAGIHQFPEYTDPWEYWQGAVEIIEKGDRGGEGVERCDRSSDNSVIYWDIEKASIVIVRDGKIVTYFKPDDADQYWLNNCD